ncbi:hypothetical protein GCM10007273_06270 [Jeotgalicoccus aerolatus]|nr:hypothetical protein GCM10007273_06270 [Jeotgalicoccus aerolatus]
MGYYIYVLFIISVLLYEEINIVKILRLNFKFVHFVQNFKYRIMGDE